MPNWVRGSLKVRGKEENIINFLKNGTSLLEGFWEPKEINPEIEINDYGEINIKNINEKIDCLYIKETTRHFIDPIDEEIFMYDDTEEKIIILENFKSAWDINTNQLQKISQKYNVDFKIYGFERGMEFNRDIEIIKGKITKDKNVKFDNYQWECINPNLGG